MKTLKRKFRIGEIVLTKSGLKAKVIGSAIYGLGFTFAWVEYRLKTEGAKRTFYRKERELRKLKEVE